MSDSDEGNQAPDGRESPVGMMGAWVGEDGDQDALILNSGPQGDEDDAAAAMVAAEVAEAMESLGEEAGAVGDPASSTSDEDSDIGPAEEEEQEEEEIMVPGRNMMMDLNQLSLVGFHIMFLHLLHTMLRRLYQNDHILVRPHGGRGIILPRHHLPGQAAQIRMLSVPDASGEGAAAVLPEGFSNRAVGSGEGFLAPEPEDKMEAKVEEESAAGKMAEAAQEEPAQEAEAPRETTEEEAQSAESKEDKEELNKKQEPEKDVDPAESRSRKSSLED